jgi:transcriptional regulator with XRE-family HTH domain
LVASAERAGSATVVFSVALFNLRDGRGWSQEDLANKLNDLADQRGLKIRVTVNTISRWERGLIERPHPLHRQLLAELFGVSLAELGLTRSKASPVAQPEKPTPSPTTDGSLRPPPFRIDPAVVNDHVAYQERRWRAVRQGLNDHRIELSDIAARLHRSITRVEDTTLISHPDWLSGAPVELAEVGLAWAETTGRPPVTGTERQARGVLPPAPDGRPYHRYAHALRDLERPTLFDNRVCFRLLEVSWAPSGGRLTFGLTSYFDMVDTSEAVAHELAAAHLNFTPTGTTLTRPSWKRLPFRKLVGDPFDLTRRVVVPSIDTLTIRRGRASASFLLHQRDPGQVAVCGGMFHVMPAGVFQPSSVSPQACSHDFDLWRNLQREFSEEFLGNLEHDGTASLPIDYRADEPFRALNHARREGKLRVYCFGVGLDPLTLWGEILTVAVIDADVFDEVFRDLVRVNAEGTVVTAGGPPRTVHGIPFTEERVEQLLKLEPMAPAAAACMALAWRHRAVILAG